MIPPTPTIMAPSGGISFPSGVDSLDRYGLPIPATILIPSGSRCTTTGFIFLRLNVPRETVNFRETGRVAGRPFQNVTLAPATGREYSLSEKKESSCSVMYSRVIVLDAGKADWTTCVLETYPEARIHTVTSATVGCGKAAHPSRKGHESHTGNSGRDGEGSGVAVAPISARMCTVLLFGEKR